MKKIMLLPLLALVALAPTAHTAAQCPIVNNAFGNGETLQYDLYFNWKFIWFKVGDASLTTASTVYGGKEAFRTNLITRTSKRADKFFVMRDTLKCYVTRDLIPLYYTKRAKEGDRYRTDEVWYSYGDGSSHAKMRHRNRRGKIKVKTDSRPGCIYDMLSIMLRARCMDLDNVKEGFTYKFVMTDAGSLHDVKLVYEGRSTFKMDHSKEKYRTLVFAYIETDEDTGKEVELVKFFITDDKNHLPVRIDMNLKFGSAKAFLRGARNVLNPQTAKIAGK